MRKALRNWRKYFMLSSISILPSPSPAAPAGQSLAVAARQQHARPDSSTQHGPRRASGRCTWDTSQPGRRELDFHNHNSIRDGCFHTFLGLPDDLVVALREGLHTARKCCTAARAMIPSQCLPQKTHRTWHTSMHDRASPVAPASLLKMLRARWGFAWTPRWYWAGTRVSIASWRPTTRPST